MKGQQTSLEFLAVFAIALLVITSIVLLSQSQIGDMSKVKDQNDAKNTVHDISAAAKEVYAQGAGARKQVYVILPSSYEPSESYISNNTIRLKARGTDYLAVEDFQVHGTLPGTDGAHWVWVVSEGNRVRVGLAMIEIDPNSVYVTMYSNDSVSTSFSVTGVWNNTITVQPTVSWTSTDVAMAVSTASFSIDPGNSHDVDLVFTASPDALGYYNGGITLSATDGNVTEEVTVPITVEVTSNTVEVTPELTVVPSVWNETMEPLDTFSKNFTVCTNEDATLTSVTFTPTMGPPGSWVGMTSPLGSMGPDSCQEKTMEITVPGGTTPGTYTGSIAVVGQGMEGAEASIEVYITVIPPYIPACDLPCNGNMPTIYVFEGIVVGGPNNGMPYTGILEGTSGHDIMTATNGDDTINAGHGNDIICACGGDDIINAGDLDDWIDAGDGNDIVHADSGRDIIYGGNGDDTIDAGDLEDVVYGGEGNDFIDGGNSQDTIYGGNGDDHIAGGPAEDDIYGGNGNDNINGGNGNDLIYAGEGNDIVDGDDNYDTMYGEAGNDYMNGGEGNDIIYGGPGEDILDGDSGYDDIFGGPDNDDIEGGSENDLLKGDDGDDIINGEGQDDIMCGGNGNDDMKGGDGQDTLDGGSGWDMLDAQSGLYDVCYNGENSINCDLVPGSYMECT
jgi:Ca2+-binding RTX toxin-like protein